MKIIHCADIHLDSKMTSNLDKEKAKERKYEILETFLGMIVYAEKNGISAVIIAGDLFDTGSFSATTRNSVIGAIRDHGNIGFYYLKGNHGGGDRFLDAIEEIPENLHLFGPSWNKYCLFDGEDSSITLSGIELDDSNKNTVYTSLMLDPRDYNIVTMHGQISAYRSADDAEVIALNELRNRNIDYLALGHVHEYQDGGLPPRGRYCYCGCLEGRGFDECGEHGFVVLEVNEADHSFRYEFIPFAQRMLHEIRVDVSDCRTTPEIRSRIEKELGARNVSRNDMAKIILTGDVDVECEKNTEYLSKVLSGALYFVKIQDDTKLAVDYKDFELDASLKGEFVRLVQADGTLSEEEKAKIIRCGFQALGGEDFEI